MAWAPVCIAFWPSMCTGRGLMRLIVEKRELVRHRTNLRMPVLACSCKTTARKPPEIEWEMNVRDTAPGREILPGAVGEDVDASLHAWL